MRCPRFREWLLVLVLFLDCPKGSHTRPEQTKNSCRGAGQNPPHIPHGGLQIRCFHGDGAETLRGLRRPCTERRNVDGHVCERVCAAVCV